MRTLYAFATIKIASELIHIIIIQLQLLEGDHRFDRSTTKHIIYGAGTKLRIGESGAIRRTFFLLQITPKSV